MFLATTLLLATLTTPRSAPSVKIEDRGAKVMLSNGLIAFAVDKSTATIQEIRLGDSPNLAGKGAYFAVANSGGKDGWDVKDGEFQIVRNSPELVEVSVKAPIGNCVFDQHYVLRKGDPGFYVYVRMDKPDGTPPESFGQVRWSCYLNPELFDYQLANDQEQAQIPDLTGAETVQDATYRAKDGKVYTKYDFCDYVENHYVHGLTGSKPNSYGAFVVMGSNEYLGAPTKQYITVHSGPIIHRFLHSGHFLPRGIAHPSLPDNWSKLCGPWYIALEKGDSPQQMWRQAKRIAERERKAWPYAWMDAPDYPLRRGQVKGRLTVDGKPAANALMVLTTPDTDWQVQILDYNFSGRADREGRFTLPKLRPGVYTLHAAIPGEVEEFAKERIVVRADETVELGDLDFYPTRYGRRLWEIGYPDRKTIGFRLSDQPRQYALQFEVPANLTYVVGKSRPDRDWYYAQAKPGDWNVRFDPGKVASGEIAVVVGIAGQTNDPLVEVLLNGERVGAFATQGNSSALYRSAILSSSYFEAKTVTFPSSKLRFGENILTFRLTKGSVMYDTVRMEVR